MVKVPFDMEGRIATEYYMDGYLKSNLDILKKANKKDWDFVILISGSGVPRVGKSVLAQQVGYYLDNSFNNWNMCLSADEFQRKSKSLIKTNKKGVALVYDEAKFGLDARRAMETVTKTLLDFFAECGQLNAYLILVLPEFFDLKKEICLNRSVCLINCYYKGEFQRGYFEFYGRKQKKFLYIRGKEYYNYHVVRADFNGRFTDFYTINEKDYRKKKSEALITGQASRSGATSSALRKQRNNIIRWMFVNIDMSVKQIAEVVGMTPRGINMIVSNQEGEQMKKDYIYLKEDTILDKLSH